MKEDYTYQGALKSAEDVHEALRDEHHLLYKMIRMGRGRRRRLDVAVVLRPDDSEAPAAKGGRLARSS